MTEDVEAIARRLSKAQRAYLTDQAVWQAPAAWAAKRWMTFPPGNTHRVLCALGLTDRAGQIRELGLAVRSFLASKEQSGE